ncbi:MAG TPA: molybdenum cofactor biosynthesis protein MoaE [Leeuwenhoekiella sp.]|nr:molybdenum cofactor biosynthesis protein MoaE [Leeuwenhoekiella sp.]
MSKKVFIEGAISPQFIADAITKHQRKMNIGAHNIFLGQVREDKVDGKKVSAIDFSCYEAMAEKKIAEIREDAFNKFDLICMHIYHSIGQVEAGQICIFVFVSTAHRPEVYEATEYIVNRVKKEVPLFGKEHFGEEAYQWKKNV